MGERPPSDAPSTQPTHPPLASDRAEPGSGGASGTLLSAPLPAARWEVEMDDRMTRAERALDGVQQRLQALSEELGRLRADLEARPARASPSWYGIAWLIALALGVLLARLLR
jgi:hypothetical protein